MNAITTQFWRNVEESTLLATAPHLVPATLNASVSETINGNKYTSKREQKINCSITQVEQTEIMKNLFNQCRIENIMKAKLKADEK